MLIFPDRYLKIKYNRNRAFNYIYTYEKDSKSLDLLFSNIEYPQQTIDSISSEIKENPEFNGLCWESFLEEFSEYNHKGHARKKEIPIASWRKFSRLIRKSIKNENFQESPRTSEKSSRGSEKKIILLKRVKFMLLILQSSTSNCNTSYLRILRKKLTI